ncbi:MAG: signal peptidase I [Candidatus Coatesbacteria bacterium RBG_13_66_14]|uniref:Signal peptidase I n=1 Tax=Candidatus Coatesbacteria bacterium RBG_13_66_14 TaxID=1817816 RepID=A0A1F5FJE1_9BACT|nr:MAG: signal peptidase I [Candidatus Coatesbacteria bacterium RBG_13_66_14]
MITDLILVIVFLAVMRNLVVESSFVLSDSMEPTLKPGDWLLVDKLRYVFDGSPNGSPNGSPKRGDIVVFNAPLEPGDEYVKRVVAIPGDTVQIEGGRLILNGTPLEEPYLSPDSRTGATGGTDPDENPFAEPVLIPPGKYLVLGDNRPASKDSRSWGLLDGEEIIGRADLVYFSYSLSVEETGVRWDRMNLPLN